MKYKYSLNIDRPHSDEIIKFAPSSSLYIDDLFYKNSMGETKSDKSYPVDVYSINVGWIL